MQAKPDKIDPAHLDANSTRTMGTNTAPGFMVRGAAHRMGLLFGLHSKNLLRKPNLGLPKYRLGVFLQELQTDFLPRNDTFKAGAKARDQ